MKYFRFVRLLAACACLTLLVLANGLGHPISESRPGNGEAQPSYVLARGLAQEPDFMVYLPLVLRSYPPPPPVFGVQMFNIAPSGGLQQAVDAGMRWVRYSAFGWDRIEPTRTNPLTYDWSVVNETSLSNAGQNGMQVIATVQFTPYWAQKYPGSYCGPIRQDQFAAFAQFLTALVNRYKQPPYNVKYWELGNEPDAPVWYNRSGYGCWGETGDPYYGGRYYGEMLKAAYPAIKAADPQAQVLIGGLLLDCDPRNPPPGKDCTPARFLEGILKAGGGPYFDAVSFHAYAYYGGSKGQMINRNWTGGNWVQTTATPEKVSFLRAVLNQYGVAGKPLLNTESALLCSQATPDCLDTQAAYIPRAYAEAMALGLEAQIYYALLNESWYYTGLLNTDLSPKPTYEAYKTAASMLSNAQYVGSATGLPTNITGYTFKYRDGSGYIDVLWSKYTSAYAMSVPPGAAVYDRFGVLLATGGTVNVDYRPVYVKRP